MERRVGRKLRPLRRKDYVIFHDVMLRGADGRTSQIDHIAVGPGGVFVIETKNRRGVIKGNDRDRKWTAGKSEFQNPVSQNRKHVSTLGEVLADDTLTFVSMVVFPDGTDFRGVNSKEVYSRSEMTPEIRYRHPVLPAERVREIADAIKAANITSRKVRREHVRRLRRKYHHEKLCLMLRICPECGKRLRPYVRNDSREYLCMHCGYDTLRTGRGAERN